MSLVSLTFGEKTRNTPSLNAEVVDSHARTASRTKSGVLEIRKVEQFLGTEEVCVIGTLASGSIALHMETLLQDKKGEVMELQSRYKTPYVAKPGTGVLVMLAGLNKEDVLTTTQLQFSAKPEVPRKKGRLIIC